MQYGYFIGHMVGYDQGSFAVSIAFPWFLNGRFLPLLQSNLTTQIGHFQSRFIMINNPISMQADLLLPEQLTLPHTASTEEGILVQPDAVLVEAAPLGFHEEVAQSLLGLLEVFYAEGTGEFVVGLAFEALCQGLVVVCVVEDFGVVG